MQGLPLLSLAIWVPIVAGLAVLTTGSDRHAPVARVVALAGAVLGFLVTIPLYIGFQPSARGFQFIELKPWIETFRVNYHLGIDGISLLATRKNMSPSCHVTTAGLRPSMSSGAGSGPSS